MNSLKQLAEMYQDDDDDEEEDDRRTSHLHTDGQGTKRSMDEREKSEDEVDVLSLEKSRWNFLEKFFKICSPYEKGFSLRQLLPLWFTILVFYEF